MMSTINYLSRVLSARYFHHTNSSPHEYGTIKHYLLVRKLLLALLLLTGFVKNIHAASGESFLLPNNQWQQLALPCKPSAVNNTVADIFSDDIEVAYGDQWMLFGFDSVTGNSVEIEQDGILQEGQAYWIIQQSGEDKLLDMPDDCTAPEVNDSSACTSATGCFEVPLSSASNGKVWNMLGYPFDFAGDMSQIRLVTDASATGEDCNEGCTLPMAKSKALIHDRFARYEDNNNDYLAIDETGIISAWSGFWVGALPKSHALNPRLLIPFSPTTPSRSTVVGQALLGPLSGAAFNVTRLGADVPTYAGTTSDGDGSNTDTAGLIELPDTVLSALEDGLYVITISGGTDIDADDDRNWNATPTPNQGSIHAVLAAQQIKNKNFNINILSELIYQDIKANLLEVQSGSFSEAELIQKINDNAGYLLDETNGDLNNDGAINLDDLLLWNPATDRDDLKAIDYSIQIEPIISKIHAGADIEGDAKYFFNVRPIADAGADQNVAQATSIRLDGSNSYDTDGTIVGYEWRYAGQTVSTDAIFTLDPLSVGTHNIELKVTDDDGATATDVVNITVDNRENCNGIATEEGYVEVTLAWADTNLNMDLAVGLSGGSMDIKDTSCPLEHFYVSAGTSLTPGSYPVYVTYQGSVSAADKKNLDTVVTIKVPGSSESRMVSLELLDSLPNQKIADIVISEEAIEFVPVDDFERESIVITYDATQGNSSFNTGGGGSSGSQSNTYSSSESGWGSSVSQNGGYGGNVIYNIIWNITQAILGGPLVGAEVDVFPADSYDAVLDDGTNNLYNTSTSYGSSVYTAGVVILPTDFRNTLEDDKLYVIRVRGGADIDPDSNQNIESNAKASQGTLHALATGEEIKSIGFKVNILTEFAYQLSKDLLVGDTATILTRVNETTRCLLDSDLDASGAIDHVDALKWAPHGGNTSKLFRQYNNDYLPIITKLHDGANIYQDVFDLAAKPLLEKSNFTIQEDLIPGSDIGKIETYCALEQAPTAYRISGVGAANFAVDNTGMLKLSNTASLRYETQRIYELYIIGSNSYGDSLPVRVYVTVTADGSPVITSELTGFVFESSTTGTEVGSLTIDDKGSPVTAMRLEGVGAENFTISTGGRITVASGATFDRELKPIFELQAVATNNIGESGPSPVTIQVQDDLPVLEPFRAKIREDIPGGTQIGQMTYYTGISPITSFDLNGLNADKFIINAAGEISIAGAAADTPILNDDVSTYRLQVIATNSYGSSKPVDAVINVIQNADSNALVVRDFSVDVVSGTENGTALGIIGYTYSLHPPTSFSLSGADSAGFQISNEGTLSLIDNSVLSDKAGQNITFAVQIANNHGSGDVGTITIQVKDDVPVLYSMDSSILENSPAGTKVGKLGYKVGISPITQFVLSGSGAGDFSIDTNGVVAVAENANIVFANQASYVLTATATNAIGRTATANISVAVHQSIPKLRDSSVQVVENSPNGERITIIPVVTIGQSPITAYTLSGPGSEVFTVDAKGNVAVADSSALDAEVVSSFNLQVSATNEHGTSEAVTLDITLIDIPDGTVPVVEAGDAQTIMFGDEATLTAVASDSDGSITRYLWQENGITLSTSSSFSKNDFSIGEHVLKVTVTDDDGNQASDTVTITVESNVDTTPPLITLSGDHILFIQSGNVYNEPGASALDNRDGSINVTVTGLVDSSAAGDYTLTYTATDLTGNTATETRLVKVIAESLQKLANIADPYVTDVAITPNGKTVFIAGDHMLQVVDVSDPTAPNMMGSLPINATLHSLSLSQDASTLLLGTSDISGSLKIVDVSNPEAPVLLGNYDTNGSETYDVAISPDGSKAFAASGINGLYVLDIINPNVPLVLNYDPTFAWAQSLTLSADGSILYLVDNSGLFVINANDPANTLLSTYAFNDSGLPFDISLSADGNTAYVAAYQNGIKFFDVSDSNQPSLLREHATGCTTLGVEESRASNKLLVSCIASFDTATNIILLNIADVPASLSAGVVARETYKIRQSSNGSILYVADGAGGFNIFGLTQSLLNGEE